MYSRFRALISLGMITLLMSACEEIFTNPVEVDQANLQTKGVVFALLANSDPRDSLFHEQVFSKENRIPGKGCRIFTSHSSRVNQSKPIFHKAKVSVRTGDHLLDLEFFDPEVLPGTLDPFYGIMEDLVPGRGYQLTMAGDSSETHQGNPRWAPVHAVDTMPLQTPVMIESTAIQFPDLKESLARGRMQIRIEDKDYRRNLYQIEATVVQSHVDEWGRNVDIVIPVQVDGGDDRVRSELFGEQLLHLIHEAEFNRHGVKQFTFTFHTNHGFFNKEKPVKLVIRLSNLSGHYAQFLKSTQRYFTMGQNPFAEPAEIYSNVENGYGIFAFAARSYDSFEIR